MSPLQAGMSTLLPRGQPSLLPVSANKILLDRAIYNHLHIAYDCFCTAKAELSSCDRNLWPVKPKAFTIWSLTEKAYLPLLIVECTV